jgi:chemotaxis protein MotB
MAKKEKEEPEEPSAPFWMVTYSDMVTLLLVFFILILSYSTIELEKFKGAMSSMKGALGIMPELASPTKPIKPDYDKKKSQRALEATKKIEQYREKMAELGLDSFVEIEYMESGVLIRLGDWILFDLSKAVIKPAAYPILSGIAETIRGEKIEMFVEGHTDNLPIKTVKYPSNWELSQGRALSVVKFFYMKEKIPAEYLVAAGHGEHRPLVKNNTPKNRAKNRRVEIFIKWE